MSDPLRGYVNAEILRWEVGRRLGVCDATGQQMDARTAVLIETPDGKTLGVVRPDAWLKIREGFLADFPDVIIHNAPKEND